MCCWSEHWKVFLSIPLKLDHLIFIQKTRSIKNNKIGLKENPGWSGLDCIISPIHMLKPQLPMWWYLEIVPCKIIRLSWGHQDRTLMMRLVFFKKRRRTGLFSIPPSLSFPLHPHSPLQPLVDRVRRWPAASQWEDLIRELNWLWTWSWTSLPPEV